MHSNRSDRQLSMHCVSHIIRVDKQFVICQSDQSINSVIDTNRYTLAPILRQFKLFCAITAVMHIHVNRLLASIRTDLGLNAINLVIYGDCTQSTDGMSGGSPLPA